MWRRGPRGNNAACWAVSWLSVTSPSTHKQIGPFWCWFPGGWVCVHSRTLGVSPMNSPVRLGVSPTTVTPRDFYSQKFWGFLFPCWNPASHGLSHSPVVPPSLSTCTLGPPGPPATASSTQSSSCCLAVHPLCPSCPSLPLLPVGMNVSSLTPWLSDFYTVQFFGSSGYFLFLNLLLSFFWLRKELKYIYLCLLLGQKS